MPGVKETSKYKCLYLSFHIFVILFAKHPFKCLDRYVLSFLLCVPVSTVCVYAVEGDVLVYGSWAPVY